MKFSKCHTSNSPIVYVNGKLQSKQITFISLENHLRYLPSFCEIDRALKKTVSCYCENNAYLVTTSSTLLTIRKHTTLGSHNKLQKEFRKISGLSKLR